MPRDGEYPIKNFRGVNLLAGADKVADNEVTQAQNLYQPTRGVWNKRFGSNVGTGDIALNGIPLCSRISGIWRHYSSNAERFTLLHCIPDATPLPDNLANLTITELKNGLGNMRNGTNNSKHFLFCYSWIGAGLEQTYSTRNGFGFGSLVFPLNAWANTAHQLYTPANVDSQAQVTIPAFPSGVTGANIFMSHGNTGGDSDKTQMVYVGTITVSAGTLIVSEFIGPSTAKVDAMTWTSSVPQVVPITGGTLAHGNYYVGLSWFCDNGVQEGSASLTTLPVQAVVQVTLSGQYNGIAVQGPDDNSTFGAKAAYVFVGTQSPDTHPMTCVGVLRVNTGFIDILSIPYHNAQTCPTMAAADTVQVIGDYAFTCLAANATAGDVYTTANGSRFTVDNTIIAGLSFTARGTGSPNGTVLGKIAGAGDATITFSASVNNSVANGIGQSVFWNMVNFGWLGGVGFDPTGLSAVTSRFGFLMSKNSSGVLNEIHSSRSLLPQIILNIRQQVFQGDTFTIYPGSAQPDIHNFAPRPRTQNDAYSGVALGATVQPYSWGASPIDPTFSYLLGITYFANGTDIPWQTDGYSLGQLSKVAAASNTLLPPIPRFIFTYQEGLVAAGGSAGNQIYGSNSNAPQNWATGGTGTAGRYISIGDAVGSGVTAFGMFTPQTEATNSPNSFMIAFKKNGTWMINTFPDPASSALSGLSSLVTGQVGATMVQVSGRVGCIAYRTIVQTPHGTVFLGQDGNIYLINSVSEPKRIGTKIQNSLTHLVSNETLMKLCTAVFHDNRWKLSYPSASTSTYNDAQWFLDTRAGEEDGDRMQFEGPHIGVNVGPQVVFVGDSDDLSRHGVDANAIRTFTLDDTAYLTDLGSPIVPILKSKVFRFGMDAHLKRILGANLDIYLDEGFTNTLLFEGFADFDYQAVNRTLSNGGATWDVSKFDQSYFADQTWDGFSFLYGDTNLSGRTFQFRVTGGGNGPLAIASVIILMRAERRRVIR